MGFFLTKVKWYNLYADKECTDNAIIAAKDFVDACDRINNRFVEIIQAFIMPIADEAADDDFIFINEKYFQDIKEHGVDIFYDDYNEPDGECEECCAYSCKTEGFAHNNPEDSYRD